MIMCKCSLLFFEPSIGRCFSRLDCINGRNFSTRSQFFSPTICNFTFHFLFFGLEFVANFSTNTVKKRFFDGNIPFVHLWFSSLVKRRFSTFVHRSFELLRCSYRRRSGSEHWSSHLISRCRRFNGSLGDISSTVRIDYILARWSRSIQMAIPFKSADHEFRWIRFHRWNDLKSLEYRRVFSQWNSMWRLRSDGQYILSFSLLSWSNRYCFSSVIVLFSHNLFFDVFSFLFFVRKQSKMNSESINLSHCCLLSFRHVPLVRIDIANGSRTGEWRWWSKRDRKEISLVTGRVGIRSKRFNGFLNDREKRYRDVFEQMDESTSASRWFSSSKSPNDRFVHLEEWIRQIQRRSSRKISSSFRSDRSIPKRKIPFGKQRIDIFDRSSTCGTLSNLAEEQWIQRWCAENWHHPIVNRCSTSTCSIFSSCSSIDESQWILVQIFLSFIPIGTGWTSTSRNAQTGWTDVQWRVRSTEKKHRLGWSRWGLNFFFSSQSIVFRCFRRSINTKSWEWHQWVDELLQNKQNVANPPFLLQFQVIVGKKNLMRMNFDLNERSQRILFRIRSLVQRRKCPKISWMKTNGNPGPKSSFSFSLSLSNDHGILCNNNFTLSLRFDFISMRRMGDFSSFNQYSERSTDQDRVRIEIILDWQSNLRRYDNYQRPKTKETINQSWGIDLSSFGDQ